MLWVSALAGDFGRQEEPLRATRYARLVGDGPVLGKWRNRRGAFLATRFPDRQIEHVDVYEGAQRIATRSFAADGRPRAAVDWVGRSVTLYTEPVLEVDFAEWSELELDGLLFWAPPLAERDGVWTGPGIAIAHQAASDPFSADFSVALAAGCGCEIEARMTRWIAGLPAAHYRLQRPGSTADVVALPVADGLLVLTAAGPDLSSLGPLRAMMATARKAP